MSRVARSSSPPHANLTYCWGKNTTDIIGGLDISNIWKNHDAIRKYTLGLESDHQYLVCSKIGQKCAFRINLKK